MTLSDKKCPLGWGNDPLTNYIEDCRDNQCATFANKSSEIADLIAIDGMFSKLLESEKTPDPFFPIVFLHRSHSAYLSASGSVMAGQLNESWALLRICLENGGYAHYVGNDERRWERWIARHDARTRSQKDQWRSEFSHGKVCRGIRAADSSIADAYVNLYDLTIDYGAHPNQRGISLGSALKNVEDDERRFQNIYLHGDGSPLEFLLRTTAQIGICVLYIAQMIYPLRSKMTCVQSKLKTIARRF